MKKAILITVICVLFLAALPGALAERDGSGSGSDRGPFMMAKELREKAKDARNDFLAAKEDWMQARTGQRMAFEKMALRKTAHYLTTERMHLLKRINNLKEDRGNRWQDLNCDLNSLPPLPDVNFLDGNTTDVNKNQLHNFWGSWKEKSRECLKEIKNQRAEWLLTYSQTLLGKAETMLTKIMASSEYASSDRLKAAGPKLAERIDKLQASISDLQAQNPHPENFWGQAHRLANASNKTIRHVRQLAFAVWKLENKPNDSTETSRARKDIDEVKSELDSDSEFNEQVAAVEVSADAELQAEIESEHTEDVSEVFEEGES